MTITSATCINHPWQAMPCPTCNLVREVAQPSRVTPLGTLPTLYVGEPTLATDPESAALIAEWVTAQNDGVTPTDVRPGDGTIKLWWTCTNAHHEPYQSTLAQRHAGKGCPECTGHPRAEYIWRIVKQLAAGDLSEVAALAILARAGMIDGDADISGPVVKGLIAAVRDEGLVPTIETDPEAVLDAVRATGTVTAEDLRKLLEKETTTTVVPTDAPEVPLTEQDLEDAQKRLEDALDKAEAGAEALTEGTALVDLIGDDEDMIERLTREVESNLWDGAMLDVVTARVTANAMLAKGGRHEQAAGNFLRQLDAAEALAIPGFVHQIDEVPTNLNLAQRRAVVTVAERGFVLNAMTVGGGKTLAAIATAMHCGTGRNVVICPAPLTDQWAKEIEAAYGSFAVEIHRSLASRSRDDRPDWWVLSVDTFSDEAKEEAIKTFAVEIGADFLVIDELHKVKQRGATHDGFDPAVSARSTRLRDLRTALAESNPRLRVMGMTGTPTLNDLSEPISLLELVTGRRMAGLGTKATPGNVSLVSLELRRHGIVTRPDAGLLVTDPVRDAPNPTTVADLLDPANGMCAVDLSAHFGDLLDAIARGAARSALPIESMVLPSKAEAFADHVVGALAEDRLIDPNAVVVAFTRHVNAVDDERIVRDYAEALKRRGLRVRTFTAADRIPGAELSASSLGCDVVIGTQPMGTGVDGLQDHARRLIILSAPWTWAEHEQVVGRLARTGQAHEVIVTPVVGWFDLPSGRRVSLEAIDLLRVLRKKRLADAVLYGVLPAEALPDEADVLSALVDWQAEVDKMLASLLDPSLLNVPIAWWDIYGRVVGRMTAHHAAGMLSRWHAVWFHEDTKDRWSRASREASVVNYGRTLERAREAWAVDPAVHIANRLRREAVGRTVVDAGCSAVAPRVALALDGLATVHSYDMASEHPMVSVADVTALPDATESADYYVLCQAIMGTNAEAYLREAYRVLRWDGFLYLAETAKHFDGRETEMQAHLRSLGFSVVHSESIGHDPEFIVIKAVKDGVAAPVAVPWHWGHLG